MTASFIVRDALDADDVNEARRLVLVYAEARATSPWVEYMRADAAALPGPYVPPRGGLWVGRANGAGVGCVALRPLDAATAEVKRMYVDPAWRGRGVGVRFWKR